MIYDVRRVWNEGRRGQTVRWMEKIEEYVVWAVTSGIAAVVGACWWAVRTIFTNQQAIELLQREIRHRDQLRQEDREALSEVRSDVKEIREWIVEGRR